MTGSRRELCQLRGKRIVVTRTRHQAPPLENLIRDCGGRPVPYPCIAIEPPQDLRPLDDCLRNLHQFDWLLATSGNTVRAIAERLSELDLSLTDAPVHVAAVGPATADELRRLLSCEVHYMPAEYGAGHLARNLPISQPFRVLLPQSDLADKSAAQILRSRGADVKTVIAYCTVIGGGGADLPALIRRREIDAITFTSPSAVSFFRQRCPSREARNLPAVCIGPATSVAAREHGFQRLISPDQPTLSDMVSALAHYFASS